MSSDTLVWLAPALGAMLAWGIAQGLVKKYIGEVRRLAPGSVRRGYAGCPLV
jgi:hypothetical protein